jgi:hypothetical protein
MKKFGKKPVYNNETRIKDKLESLSISERLELFYFKELNYLYQSGKKQNFKINKVESLLKTKQFNGFKVIDAITVKNITYVEISYELYFTVLDYNKQPMNRVRNEISFFTLNCIEANNSVNIYGLNTNDINTKNALYNHSNELINKL